MGWICILEDVNILKEIWLIHEIRHFVQKKLQGDGLSNSLRAPFDSQLPGGTFVGFTSHVFPPLKIGRKWTSQDNKAEVWVLLCFAHLGRCAFCRLRWLGSPILRCPSFWFLCFPRWVWRSFSSRPEVCLFICTCGPRQASTPKRRPEHWRLKASLWTPT